MNNYKNYLWVMVSLLLGLTIYSCTKDHFYLTDLKAGAETPSEMLNFENETTTDIVDLLRLPIGTTVTETNTGIDFNLPDGYALVSRDENGGVITAKDGSYTCTCKSGESEGCSPFKAKGQYGCLGGGCKTCEGKAGDRTAEWEEDAIIINFNEPLVYYESLDELKATPLSQAVILEIPEVAQTLEEFTDFIYPEGLPAFLINGDPIPDGYNHVAISLYGTLAFMVLPDDTDTDSPRLITGGAGIKCSCGSGSSGCEKKKKLGIEYCDGDDCTSCTLSDRRIAVKEGLDWVEYSVEWIGGYIR